MSAPSFTACQTDFCNATYTESASPRTTSGCDTPIPFTGIPQGTLKTLTTNPSSIKDEESLDTLTFETKTPFGVAMGTPITPNYANIAQLGKGHMNTNLSP